MIRYRRAVLPEPVSALAWRDERSLNLVVGSLLSPSQARTAALSAVRKLPRHQQPKLLGLVLPAAVWFIGGRIAASIAVAGSTATTATVAGVSAGVVGVTAAAGGHIIPPPAQPGSPAIYRLIAPAAGQLLPTVTGSVHATLRPTRAPKKGAPPPPKPIVTLVPDLPVVAPTLAPTVAPGPTTEPAPTPTPSPQPTPEPSATPSPTEAPPSPEVTPAPPADESGTGADAAGPPGGGPQPDSPLVGEDLPAPVPVPQ